MNRIAKFEKVSLKQFKADYEACFGTCEGAEEAYDKIKLPVRATSGSAGYDIVSPVDIKLFEGEWMKVPTGLRVKIDDGWVLLILPKSGLGTKHRLQLDNTCGVIDSDYYGADNEGHIMISLSCDSHFDKAAEVSAGKAFVQAIFVPFGITSDDDAGGQRTGGFGSTNA